MWVVVGQTVGEAVLEGVAAAALSTVVRHGVAELARATTGMPNALLGVGRRMEVCNRVASRQFHHGARPKALLVAGVHHPLGVVVHRHMLAMACRDHQDLLGLASSHRHPGVVDGDQAHLQTTGVGPMPRQTVGKASVLGPLKGLRLQGFGSIVAEVHDWSETMTAVRVSWQSGCPLV